MARPSTGNQRKSVWLSPEMIVWLQIQAAAKATSENTIVRQALLAAMADDTKKPELIAS